MEMGMGCAYAASIPRRADNHRVATEFQRRFKGKSGKGAKIRRHPVQRDCRLRRQSAPPSRVRPAITA